MSRCRVGQSPGSRGKARSPASLWGSVIKKKIFSGDRQRERLSSSILHPDENVPFVGLVSRILHLLLPLTSYISLESVFTLIFTYFIFQIRWRTT